jgi:hypothetical protein
VDTVVAPGAAESAAALFSEAKEAREKVKRRAQNWSGAPETAGSMRQDGLQLKGLMPSLDCLGCSRLRVPLRACVARQV